MCGQGSSDGGSRKSPCHRGAKRVCETHLAEGTAEDFEPGARRGEEIACSLRCRTNTPRKLWLLVEPPVRDFIFCDSAPITAKENSSVFVNVRGVSASVLENCCEVFGWTVPRKAL